MRDDTQLLIEFVQERSEEAFAELVRRHLDLVYGVALRMVGRDSSMAEDVTQTVFADLARKAGRLSAGMPVGGWLHRHTCFTASKAVRAEQRRRKREAVALALQEQHDSPPASWESVAPHLDASLNQLKRSDRESLILRFLQSQSLRSVGEALGVSEDAAQKRVGRALQRLRVILSRRGVSGSGLASVIVENSVSAAPTHLIEPVVARAVSAAQPVGWLTSAIQTVVASKFKVVALGLATVCPLWVVYQAELARDEQDQRLAAAKREWERARSASEVRAAERTSHAQVVQGPSPEFRELLRLRGEVGRQRQRLREGSETAQASGLPRSRGAMLSALQDRYAERVAELQSLFAARPEASVPELSDLTEADWLFLVRQQVSEDEAGIRWLMSRARTMAESEFGNRVLKPALDRYAAARPDSFPVSLAALEPYFDSPVDPAILERWVVMRTDHFHESLRHQVDADEWVLTQGGAIDPEYDQRYVLGIQEVHLFAEAPAEFWEDQP